jgi:hypothetical protein
MCDYPQAVLNTKTPCKYKDNAGGCKQPEPECCEEGRDEVDNAVGEPCLTKSVVPFPRGPGKPTKTSSAEQRECVPA